MIREAFELARVQLQHIAVGDALLGPDLPDFDEVMPEAYELLERGFMSEQDFREFTFTNVARLHAGNNPGFFAGTVVARAVAGSGQI